VALVGGDRRLGPASDRQWSPVRRTGPRSAAIALQALTDALAPATLLAEVQRAWPAAAGEAFACVCEPVAERDGTVTVACASAVWAQELDLLSEPVLERLNAALGRPAVLRLRAQATGSVRRW
jgi:predicted nucleic acid-binding Zn ribbon protein